LNFWRKESGDEEVKAWVSEAITQDANLALFLEGYLSSASSFSFGDAVRKTYDRLDPDWLRPYLDPDLIVDRVRSLAQNSSISGRQKRALD
jgi:predicted KAP-like P-loop ATPase